MELGPGGGDRYVQGWFGAESDLSSGDWAGVELVSSPDNESNVSATDITFVTRTSV